MHLGNRLRRIMATMILLLGLLAGLGVASANTDALASIEEGDHQTPRTAEQTPGITPGSATSTPLSSPSPIETASPLNPETSSPNNPPSPTDSPDSTNSASTKPSDTDDQAMHMVRFDPADGSKPTQASVKTGTLATPPQHNPVREGFRFDGWTYDSQPYNFQTPILQDTSLTAKWTKATDWTLSPNHGPASGARLTINPPDRQEPYYTSIQAAGEQTVGLTGDGRIYTWTQEGTPKQVPAPVQAADRFRYLQAAAGSRWQAALGSDQRIYTWNSQQAIPTILDTGQNARFTSISMNNDRLLAVDQQGQAHAFQASQAGTQDPAPKFEKQAAASLSGKAQAVTAVASGGRILIVDADGQAWTWETVNAGKAKPSRAEQDPGTRTVQTQALSQGFILLDADGHAQYLADSKTSPTALSLPGGTQVERIASNDSQAIITDKDGHIWAWKPGETPKRADNGSQQYTQAVETGNRVTALDRQDGLYRWSLDGQGKPGKPARIDTTQAPILESACMDGQPLTLNKNNDAWQADMPARKPGPAAITITGRQDSQPFTRNLDYTADQTLTRDTQQDSTYTVHFNTGEGSPTPQDQSIQPVYGRVQRPSPDPTREGFLFDGWFINEVAYDFSKPVTQNLTLNAKWTSKNTNNTWKINPDKGSQLGGQKTTITPPSNRSGVKFNQVSNGYGQQSLAVGSDGNAYAWGDNSYGQLGDGTRTPRTTPVMVKKPAGAPTDFTYVQISAGYQHSLALGSDGYVYTWGFNGTGQLGNNTSESSIVPVRVRDPSSPNDATKGLKAVQVSAGSNHSLALDAQGDMWTWGSNNWNVVGKNAGSSNSYFPVRICDPAQPNDKTKGLKATQISTGYVNSSALDLNGNIWVWGANDYGQLGKGTSARGDTSAVPVRVRDPSSPNDATKGLKATQVSTHGNHSLAIDTDGNTWAWGWNGYGQLGNNSISTGSGDNARSTVPVPVRDPSSPNDKSKSLKAIQVCTGTWHSLAIDTNGNTWAWGWNSNGQLGDNTTSDRTIPVKVFASQQSTNKAGPWLSATSIIGGYYHSLAIDKDGNTEAWGYNIYGQLGNNTTYNSNVPVSVVFNLPPVITGIKFDQTPATGLTRGDSNSASVITPAHVPGTVTVSVDYTMGGSGQTLTDTYLRYTYTSTGVLPRAGGEGIMLSLATGMTGMCAMLAVRRHRREQHRLLHASLE